MKPTTPTKRTLVVPELRLPDGSRPRVRLVVALEFELLEGAEARAPDGSLVLGEVEIRGADGALVSLWPNELLEPPDTRYRATLLENGRVVSEFLTRVKHVPNQSTLSWEEFKSGGEE